MTECYYIETRILPKGAWLRSSEDVATCEQAVEGLRNYMSEVSPPVVAMLSYRVVHKVVAVLVQGTLEEVLNVTPAP